MERLDQLNLKKTTEVILSKEKCHRMKPIALAITALSVVLASGSVSVAGDEAKGKRVFNKCRACHSLVAGISKIGPSLNGVMGRKAGNWKKKTGNYFLTLGP